MQNMSYPSGQYLPPLGYVQTIDFPTWKIHRWPLVEFMAKICAFCVDFSHGRAKISSGLHRGFRCGWAPFQWGYSMTRQSCQFLTRNPCQELTGPFFDFSAVENPQHQDWSMDFPFNWMDAEIQQISVRNWTQIQRPIRAEKLPREPGLLV